MDGVRALVVKSGAATRFGVQLAGFPAYLGNLGVEEVVAMVVAAVVAVVETGSSRELVGEVELDGEVDN